MRIRDWSSDLCSSDLGPLIIWSISVHTALIERPTMLNDMEAVHRHIIGRRSANRSLPPYRAALTDEIVEILSTFFAKERPGAAVSRSEEHTSELQSLMRISYAVFCLKKKTKSTNHTLLDTLLE